MALPPAAALLGRLEDHDRGAGEVARLGEVARAPEQHRGVPVMAAGVHLARHGRLVRDRSFASSIGSASISARSPITLSDVAALLLPRISPTTPVRPRPVTTSSQPNALSFSATDAAGAVHSRKGVPDGRAGHAAKP
jgi:hypothetical protein